MRSINGKWYDDQFFRWVENPLNGGNVRSWSFKNILAGLSDEEIVARHERIERARVRLAQRRKENGGWKLGAYHWEHQTFPQFQTVIVERERVQKMLDKMCKHFNLPPVRLDCMNLKRGQAGHYTPSTHPYITLSKEPTLGLVCHEFAHHYTKIKYNPKLWHGEQFKRCLSGVYEYAERWLPKQNSPEGEIAQGSR